MSVFSILAAASLVTRTFPAHFNLSERVDDASDAQHFSFAYQDVPLVRLTRDLLSKDRYDIRIRPISNHSAPLKIHISMSLYQIVDVKWSDEMLDWNPHEYGMINSTILPHSSLWIPDTYLYNSVVMSRDETERYMNVQVASRYWEGKPGANMSLLYPAIYTITCRLNVRYFPYDQQNCTLTISSWTNNKRALDYYADESVNMQSFIPNEEWDVMSFRVYRHEHKYACCSEPWVIIVASLVIRRKPLYYVVNLIIPTSIITIVSITGFFTPASTSDDRTEKIDLGITTLLAMSILMLMVSDQMPTTSEFIPLIAWFYLSIIIIVSIGTFFTIIVLSVQGRRKFGKMPTEIVRVVFFVYIAHWMCLSVPSQLLQLWDELNDHPVNCRTEGTKNMGKLTDEVGSSPNQGNETKALQRKETNNSGNVDPETNVEKSPQSVHSLPRAPLKTSRWLKIPQNTIITDKRSHRSASDASIASKPQSPNSPRSRQRPLWESAMAFVGCSNDGKQSKDKVVSAEVTEMKQRRQCSLEWEFLATILDRMLLIVFTIAVLIVTMGLVVIGHMAQHGYDEKIG
uniref:Uncharacterized protein n=1 Tax=Parascaris univalens TaxID=6257 RepID=A0A915BC90_PARUN